MGRNRRRGGSGHSVSSGTEYLDSNETDASYSSEGDNLTVKGKLQIANRKQRPDPKGPWLRYAFCLGSLIVVLCAVILMKNQYDLYYMYYESGIKGKTESNFYQKMTLKQQFNVDYHEIMRTRELLMEKYEYNYSLTNVDRRSQLSLQEFRDVYDGKWPVLLTDVVPQWPASNWSRSFLTDHYGSHRVTMKAVDRELDAVISQVLTSSLLGFAPGGAELEGDLQDTVAKGSLSDAVSLALPLELFSQNTHRAQPHQWTYVEDELFIPMRPELRAQLWNSVYLEEDFFQLFPESVRPWDAMLLWGTAFSRSSLHIDPYNWTGTNAVLTGRKRWKMYPPGQDHFLYVIEDQRSGFPLDCYKYNSPIDAFEPDYKKYPLFRKAHSFEFDQLPGELLIIPTGWFHQAYNVEETIAVSGQLMNSNNYRIVLEEILKAGNVARQKLSSGINELSAKQQVIAVLSHLPRQILERGKTVTEAILKQMAQENTPGPSLPYH